MNKRDLYKSLLEENMFDKEKIFKNAKKGKLAGQRPTPLYIGLTAAAAAAVVGVGTVAVTLSDKHDGAVLVNSNSAMLPAQNRVEQAIKDILENQSSNEMHDVLITFSQPMTADAARSVLTAYSDESVKVKMLIFSDKTRADGEKAVGEAFSNGRGQITGAVINCAGYLMARLQNDAAVYAVELVTDRSFSELLPIEPDPEVSVPQIPEVSEPQSSAQIPVSSPVDSGSSSGNSPSSVPNDGTESTASSSSSQPSSSSVSVNEVYASSEISAQEAFFLSDGAMLVKNADGIALYEFSSEEKTLRLAAECRCSDILTRFVSEDGKKLLFSAKNGENDVLLFVDAAQKAIYELDGLVGHNYNDILYSAENDFVVFTEFDGDKCSLCMSKLYDGKLGEIVTVYSSQNPPEDGAVHGIALLAVKGDKIYFIENGTIYEAYWDVCEEIISVPQQGFLNIKTTLAGSCAVIKTETGVILFSAGAKTIAAAPADGTVEFGAAENVFSCGGKYYEFFDGISEITENIGAAERRINYKNGFSQKFSVSLQDGLKIFEVVTSGSEKPEEPELPEDPDVPDVPEHPADFKPEQFWEG